MRVHEREPLGPRTTMGVGGPARFLVDARSEDDVMAAAQLAGRRGLPLLALGQGSNVVVADQGVEAVVAAVGIRGVDVRETGGAVEVTAGAGEPWDPLVAETVARGWAGLECLSGIPGLVGATPIQNVGAYGQDVGRVVTAVRVLDRRTGRIAALPPEACGFAYRQSAFKRRPGEQVVLAVTFRLNPGGPPTLRYAEVARHLEARAVTAPGLGDVREAVIRIRRGKSMVLDPADPNGRSCGSFFLNPVVAAETAARVAQTSGDPAMPSWREPGGRVKLSAAWLIERAGFSRGDRDGPVGLSTHHSLAVVAHHGARAADVVRFARRLRDGVERRFGLRLVPEPVFWGFGDSSEGLPAA